MAEPGTELEQLYVGTTSLPGCFADARRETTQRMNAVEFEQGAVRIDASIIAAGLAIEPALVLPLLRAGKITSLCERGVDQDAGRVRLTFFHENRRLRLITDTAGNIIDRCFTDGDHRGAP
jgi:hypothetical protein